MANRTLSASFPPSVAAAATAGGVCPLLCPSSLQKLHTFNKYLPTEGLWVAATCKNPATWRTVLSAAQPRTCPAAGTELFRANQRCSHCFRTGALPDTSWAQTHDLRITNHTTDHWVTTAILKSLLHLGWKQRQTNDYWIIYVIRLVPFS